MGTNKGYLYGYEVSIQREGRKVVYKLEESCKGTNKRGSAPITTVKFLQRSTFIAFIIGTQLQTISFHDLGSQQTFKKKASKFCVNNAVYKTGPGASAFDQICAADEDKKVTFYAFKPQDLKFEEDRELPGFSLPQVPLQLIWDDQLLYVGAKKAFYVVVSKTGEIKQKVEHTISVTNPLMAMSNKGKCLISVPKSGEAVFFEAERGQRSKPRIPLDSSKTVVALAL